MFEEIDFVEKEPRETIEGFKKRINEKTKQGWRLVTVYSVCPSYSMAYRVYAVIKRDVLETS